MASLTRRTLATALAAAVAASRPASAQSPSLSGGTLRVGVLNDMSEFDPQQFSTINFPFIKNFYDSLIEYTETGKPVPSLAESWKIAGDNRAVTLQLRRDVTFHSGASFTSADVVATLAKGADPKRGKNIFATLAIVDTVQPEGPNAVTLTFKKPAPDKLILDLLQFVIPIEAAGIATVETKPAGTGPFRLVRREVGQSVSMAANRQYWRKGEPILDAVEVTVFTDDASLAAALESGAVDLTYNGQSRSAVRLRNAGYTLIAGPGQLVQVFRINVTRGPFRNEKYRQAFNYLMDRASILKVGYAGLGVVTALPWAPASPAADPSYNTTYAYDPEKAKALLKASGLSAVEMSGWSILTNANDEATVAISQIVQESLEDVGIKVNLDMRQSAEYTAAQLAGDYTATFGGVGNVQKLPSRIATNSIYRTTGNPVLKDPNPFPAYVEAIARIDTTLGSGAKAAYDNLNKVLVDSAFGIATNSYETGLIVAARNVRGFTPDIDNLLVLRTVGFVK